MEIDTGDDLAYLDDETDEDFVPPSKRHSPRRSLKPSNDVTMKRSAGKSTPKLATGKYVEEKGFKFDCTGGGRGVIQRTKNIKLIVIYSSGCGRKFGRSRC